MTSGLRSLFIAVFASLTSQMVGAQDRLPPCLIKSVAEQRLGHLFFRAQDRKGRECGISLIKVEDRNFDDPSGRWYARLETFDPVTSKWHYKDEYINVVFMKPGALIIEMENSGGDGHAYLLMDAVMKHLGPQVRRITLDLAEDNGKIYRAELAKILEDPNSEYSRTPGFLHYIAERGRETLKPPEGTDQDFQMLEWKLYSQAFRKTPAYKIQEAQGFSRIVYIGGPNFQGMRPKFICER